MNPVENIEKMGYTFNAGELYFIIIEIIFGTAVSGFKIGTSYLKL